MTQCKYCKKQLEVASAMGKDWWQGLYCPSCEYAFRSTDGHRCPDMPKLGGSGAIIGMHIDGDKLYFRLGSEDVTIGLHELHELRRQLRRVEDCMQMTVDDNLRKDGDLDRWLIDADGAEFRPLGGFPHRVKLRRTTPKRDWNCDACDRVLIAGSGHWIGTKSVSTQFFSCSAKPRFCDACVHDGRTRATEEPVEPRGLRLVVDQ